MIPDLPDPFSYPEYDDCKTLADKVNIPVRQVWEAASALPQTLRQ
jgi:uncharacterized protein (DUF111 family)